MSVTSIQNRRRSCDKHSHKYSTQMVKKIADESTVRSLLRIGRLVWNINPISSTSTVRWTRQHSASMSSSKMWNSLSLITCWSLSRSFPTARHCDTRHCDTTRLSSRASASSRARHWRATPSGYMDQRRCQVAASARLRRKSCAPLRNCGCPRCRDPRRGE